jgi:hypothetical protein
MDTNRKLIKQHVLWTRTGLTSLARLGAFTTIESCSYGSFTGRVAWAGDEYCHVGRQRRGTWIKLTKVTRGTGQEVLPRKGEQGRITSKGGSLSTQVCASSRPVEITAHERPSLGRGQDPSSSDGGRNPHPQQPGRDAPRHGPASPVRGSRADATTRNVSLHSRRPWAATGCFYPRAAQYAPASYGPRHRK